jgi:hypothetical protein
MGKQEGALNMVEEIKGRLVRKVADKLLDKLLDGSSSWPTMAGRLWLASTS